METIDDFTKSLLERARARDILLTLNENSSSSSSTKENCISMATDSDDIGGMGSSGGTDSGGGSSGGGSSSSAGTVSCLASSVPDLVFTSSQVSASPLSRKVRLSALAKTINDWEDQVLPTPQAPPPNPVQVQQQTTKKQVFSPSSHAFVSSSPLKIIHHSSPLKQPSSPPNTVKLISPNKPLKQSVEPFVNLLQQPAVAEPFVNLLQQPAPQMQVRAKPVNSHEESLRKPPIILAAIAKRDPSELTVKERARLFDCQRAGGGDRAGRNVERNKPCYFGDSFERAAPAPAAAPIPPPTETAETLNTNKKRVTATPSNSSENKRLKRPTSVESSPQTPPSASVATGAEEATTVAAPRKLSLYPSLLELQEEDSPPPSPESFSSGGNESMSTSSISFHDTTTEVSDPKVPKLSTSAVIRQIDDCIDEALEGQTIDDTTFFNNHSPLNASSPIHKIQQQQPLVHTVSCYRMKSAKKGEDRVVVGQNHPPGGRPILPQGVPDVAAKETTTNSERLCNLEEQLLIQERSIAQASKALSICETSFEFVNSTENLEGERVLLIACEKRSSLLKEIAKCKRAGGGLFEPSGWKGGDAAETVGLNSGQLELSGLQIYPTKQRGTTTSDYAYHFIVLVKHEEHVFSSNTVTLANASNPITFDTNFAFPALPPHFKIVIEVHALRTFKLAVIDHHVKYHIKKNASTPKKSTFLTPQKLIKGTDFTPRSSSSTGSRTTSNFTLQGSLTLDLSNFQKTTTDFPLSLTSQQALLLPNISLSITSITSNRDTYSGFLTVFKDVAGLGAWHRRWATLDERFQLLFWTYPEDVNQKAASEKIILKGCITGRVSPAPRETCARPNTFLLVTTREPLPSDKETLVLSVHPNYTAIKHLLSADNREERDVWINFLNKAITNMRAWGYAGSD